MHFFFFSLFTAYRFQSLRFLLTNTRVPRETQVQVANVRKLHDKVTYRVKKNATPRTIYQNNNNARINSLPSFVKTCSSQRL
jgi:hypothetical protein